MKGNYYLRHVSLCLSVCVRPSVYPHGEKLISPLADFHEI